jgi:TolB-like protein/DNA-binding winged helix-turn-helix (wHTH) protein/Tfp pilus assembly protein PilF
MIFPVNSVLRIGDLRVDPALDEIQKDGVCIKIEPRTMRLLICLAEHAGQVVGVEELLDRVWKDVVVSPDSVYRAVASLRRAIGDDVKEPRYIANVMRRGYRLVAPASLWTEVVEPRVGGAAARALDNAHEFGDALTLVPRASRAGLWIRIAFATAVTLAAGAAVGVGYLALHYSWLAKHGSPPGHRLVAAANPLEKSVAVLPFLDMSEKKDEEFFADGMSEELIDRLAKVPELKVPARTSSFYFKGKQVPLADIAKALGVAHVLEGSIRKSGDTLRITAELIRVDSGYHVWSESFDRPMADVFKVQDDISGAVVKALKISLLEAPPVKVPPTSSSAAYTLYLRAWFVELGGGTPDYDLARAYLEQALVLDPKFALGWARLAVVWVEDLDWHPSNPESVCPRAHAAIQEAIKLDPELSESFYVLGRIANLCDKDYAAADAAYTKALALDPRNAHALTSYSIYAWERGRPEQALELAQEAVIREPLNSWVYHALGLAQSSTGHLEEAVASWRKAIELDPAASGHHALLTNALLAVGRPAEALEVIQAEPDELFREMNLFLVYDALGRKEDADRSVEKFIKKYGTDGADSIGEFYACRMDVDRAVEWLKKIGTTFPEVANRQACIDKISHDPRYRAMVEGFKDRNKKPIG